MEELNALIKYRLEEASESLEEAEILLKENKLRGAMNRVYYSMFYSALALLAAKQLRASKHSGVISVFHKEFVKSGLFPKEVAKFLDIAFDLRNKSDYRDFLLPERDRIIELLKEAKQFLIQTEKILNKLRET